MSLQNLLNPFIHTASTTVENNNNQSQENPLINLTKVLAGGVAAGGIMVLLTGNNKVSKRAGKQPLAEIEA